ncbi:alpha/beta hydrolase family protein [Nannocystaceae bacterium ST9]
MNDTSTSSATDTATDTDTTNADSSESGEPDFETYDQPGPYAVGTRAFVLADPQGDRELEVQLWYPAEGGPGSDPIGAFVTAEPNAGAFQDLVDAASEPCTRKITSSRFDAARATEPAGLLPTVLFSHCHTCTRFSSYSLAERLASHGFLVAAVDHAGNTLFDQLAGDPLPVDAATLELRASDMRRLLDELLDPATSSLPAEFVGLADPERVGVFGHSFGSVTTGKLLQDDDRFVAGVGIAAPFESPILPGISMAAIEEPILLLVAVEDNSITEIGNNILRNNFTIANTPAWKIEFTDAGHWSFSDICNLIDGFQPGCGEGQRQTNPDESFTYLDNQLARDLTATKVTSFFALTLRGEAEARTQLEAGDPVLDIAVRE